MMQPVFANRMFESGMGIRSNFFNQRDMSFLGQPVQIDPVVLNTLAPKAERDPRMTVEQRRSAEAPSKPGFHGKTRISYQEAKELLAALDEVLKPLTTEELANDIDREECLRDLAVAGNFPIVERLHERLTQFVAAGDTGATFEISAGEINVTEKAIDCAVALGRGKAIRTALTVGGVVGAGALLLLLL